MDKEIFDRYVLLQDMMKHKNDPENSDFIKDIQILPDMLEFITDSMTNEKIIETMPKDCMTFFMLVQKFANDLRPIYLKTLIIKEKLKNEQE